MPPAEGGGMEISMNIKKNIIKKCPSDTHKQFLEYAFCFFQEKNCKAILKGSIQKDTAHKFSDIDLVLKRMDKELVREFIFNFGEVVLISRTQRPLGILIVIYSDGLCLDLDFRDGKYLRWDNWDGGMWFIELDYDHEFTLYRGTVYPSSLKNNTGDFVDIKAFIEIAYKHWIINTGECHYKFTIEVNDRFKIFKLPYRLQNGIVIKQGYKSTSPIDKIINYRMFERKIQFSEEMINSKDIMEKKSALDFIIDALQYLISTKGDTRNEQYKALALSVSDNMDGKVYAVVKKELDELMKLSNEYFDVRHNDYLNAAKEKREPLNDSQFIEYLYNRAYSILYLLRLKS